MHQCLNSHFSIFQKILLQFSNFSGDKNMLFTCELNSENRMWNSKWKKSSLFFSISIKSAWRGCGWAVVAWSFSYHCIKWITKKIPWVRSKLILHCHCYRLWLAYNLRLWSGVECMTVKKFYVMKSFAMKRQNDVSRECEQIIGQ